MSDTPPPYLEEDEDPAVARRSAVMAVLFCLVMIGATVWVALKFLLESPGGG